MSFGWSVGDIVQAVKSINNLIQALDSVNGAARDYREAISFLTDLSTTLKPLQQSEAIDANCELQDAIKEQVMAIKGPVEEFLQQAVKFEGSLGSEASKGGFRTIPRKLQWHYSTSSRVKTLRDKVDRHMRILDTLLLRSTAGLIYQLPSEMRAIFHEVLEERLSIALQQSLQPLEANIMAQWTAIDRAPEAIVGYLHDHNYLGPMAKDAILETMQQHRLEGIKSYSTTNNKPESTSESLEPPSGPTENSPSLIEFKSHSTRFLEKHRHGVEDKRVSRQIIGRLGTWWRSGQPLLWIQEAGRQFTNSPSDISVVVIFLAKENEIPVFFHSCRTRVDQMGRDLKPEIILLELVESLSEQMQLITQGLVRQKGSKKDSSLPSPPSADIMENVRSRLKLIQCHIDRFKGVCLLVLDGLNYLDYSGDKEVEDGLASLLDMLYPKQVSSSGCAVKTLLTTQGQSKCLLDRVSFEDKVDVVRAGHGDDDILLAGLRRQSAMK